jgi:hypothetical protein
MDISLRSVLHTHLNSLDRLRDDLNLARPASARDMAVMHPGRFCGFPDPPKGIGLHTTAYTLKGIRRKLNLSWTVSGSGLGVTNPQPVLNTAFQRWQNGVTVSGSTAPALTLNFVPSPPPPLSPASADITITFRSLNTPPGPFVVLGKTAPDGSTIQLDSATLWAPNVGALVPGSRDLLAVAMHEIGHALGLLHSTSDNSVMNPFAGNVETLTPDDLNGASALYGWEPQRQILGRGSDRGPALCACGGVLAMAWKGIGDDQQIYFSTSTDGLNWTPQVPIPGIGTSDSPSLAWDGANLWMAWKGVPGDQSLFFATTSNPLAWPANPGQLIPGVGSSFGPLIATLPRPSLAWKGVEGDSGLFFSTFTAGGNPPWSAQQRIAGVGSSDRPALVADVNNLPLLVWTGVTGDYNLYASNLTGIFWQPQQKVSWIVPGNGPVGGTEIDFPGSFFSPGTARVGNRVLLFWRGTGEDQQIWFTQRALDTVGGAQVIEWSSQGNIPGVGTSDRPAAAFFNGRVHVAWKGVGNDHNIFMTRL